MGLILFLTLHYLDHSQFLLNNQTKLNKWKSKNYLPSGKSISEVGVTPDIYVEEEGNDFLINSDKDNQLNN